MLAIPRLWVRQLLRIFLCIALATVLLVASPRLPASAHSERAVEVNPRQRDCAEPVSSTQTFLPRRERVTATEETKPVPNPGDAADDPAIWLHPSKPHRSVIIATDKKGGLGVYSLSGMQLQYRADGRMNNVDLRCGFRHGSRVVALVAASNRSDDTVALYRVDSETRTLVPLRPRKFRVGIAVHGLCMYRSTRDGRFSVFVTSKRGEVEQWLIHERTGAGGVRAERVRSFDVGSESEGCVADDRLARLYVAEESHGIWRYGAEPSAGDRRKLVDAVGRQGHLKADVEGLAIAAGPGDGGYLVASSQGADAFVVYQRRDNSYVTTFSVEATDSIEGLSGTDGIEVMTASLGPRFPHGVFVGQDGRNDGNQNFKLVAWEEITRFIGRSDIRCGGERATLVGTGGSDVLEGTPGSDVIVGLGGDDLIRGGSGDDLICGAGGADTIRGGRGADRLFGGAGDDLLLGRQGNDALVGGRGMDRCAQGPGRGPTVSCEATP